MTVRSRLRVAVAALALVAGLAPVATAPAGAQTDEDPSGADAVAACEPITAVPEIGHRLCGGLERALWLTAQHCRRVPGLDEALCPAIDGREVHEAAVAEFERSWTARALQVQRTLDDEVPLTEALILHTHNSANSAAYEPSLTTNDANQVLTVTDQLRLGIRAIELDAHWAPHPAGDPAHGLRAPVQCHGQSLETPAGNVHVGCSVDQLLVDLFAEVRAWIDRPEHAGELVLLYLENQLDGEEAAHAATVAALESTLGDLVFRPETGGGCQQLPVHRSESEILAAGARVLITGNCGPGGWTDWVFERGEAWDESGSTTDYLAGSDCDAERAAHDYGNRFVRRYEDSTFLSLMANGGSYISPEVAASLVRCGVNMPGLDQLHPGDERLPAFVWSWRDQAPLDDPTRACAAPGGDARFGALACATELPVACRTSAGGWAVTERSVPWQEGDRACTDEGHEVAGTPANGWENQLLRRAVPGGTGDVWLAYGRDVDGRWVTGIPAPVTEPGGPTPGDGGPPDHAGPPDDRAGPPAHAGTPGPPASPPGPAATDDISAVRTVPGAALLLVVVAILLGSVVPRWRTRAGAPTEPEPTAPGAEPLP